MEFSAQQLADLLKGKIEGDAQVKVNQLSKIEEGVPGSVSFLANPLYTQYIYGTKASLVIVNESLELTAPVSCTLLRVPSAEQAFAKLLELYNQVKLNKTGVSAQAYISEKAQVGDQLYAGAFAVISDGAKIGNNVKIYPQVYIGDNVVIGDNTTLFAGVKVDRKSTRLN
ncbi:MAG: UDP-3-O-(3-hydroxymyristoyl)glucosamine N-acyltransferase, partial [Chitinophagaceae bacterium]|nr:UDP-3-O-(3-hydroxymyristoyl)glucosamine N-acyltransferase [Chitinophagaceae bacterium]